MAAELPAHRSRALIEALGSSSREPLARLGQFPGLSDTERKRIREAIEPRDFIQSGIKILHGESLPELLHHAPGSPPACFYWGEEQALAEPCIAIVGTRSASTYGKACAQKFAEALAAAGATIVSGGALGIDAAAHKGALAVDGRTVAVVAGGLDHVYPAVHAGLFQQIRERGGIVSQFALGSRPDGYKFLQRNGLIAALSLAVLVIEAPAKSGALHTAVAAAELGREVFVVPADINRLSFHGSFNLIRDGATLVDNPLQVVEALGLEAAKPKAAPAPASDVGKQILSILGTDPVSAEMIVQRTGLPTSDVLTELTMLELEGRVMRDGVGYALRP